MITVWPEARRLASPLLYEATNNGFGNSGDVIDVFPYGHDGTVLAMVDVSGRGPQAAGYANFLRRATRDLGADTSPAQALTQVNAAFSRALGKRRDDVVFATFFLAALRGRTLTYASAGHDLAMLVTPSGEHEHLPSTGLLLGLDEDEQYWETSVTANPGDWLVVVSDGVTDVRNRAGTFFGTCGVAHRAMTSIARRHIDPAQSILEAAREHGGGQFTDDASVLCVQFP